MFTNSAKHATVVQYIRYKFIKRIFKQITDYIGQPPMQGINAYTLHLWEKG